jgi:hypothetical protein
MFRLPAGTPDRGYDVPADGKKFLTSVMASLNTDAAPSSVTVVLNWPSALKK